MRIVLPFLWHCFWVLVVLSGSPAHAFSVEEDYYGLSERFQYLVDESGGLGLEHVLSEEIQQQFHSSAVGKPKPIAPEAVIWLKLELSFIESRADSPYVLTALVNNFSDIRVFRQNSAGEYMPPLITGNSYPASQREINIPRFSFYIYPTKEKTQIVYIRLLGSLDTHGLPWVLVERQLFERSNKESSIINLLSMGTLLGVIALCLCIGLILPSKKYLIYSAFLVTGLLSWAYQDGLAFFVLWPNHPEFNYYMNDIIVLALSLTRLITIMLFLDIAFQFPRINYYCKVLAWFLAVALVVASTYGLKPISELLGGFLWASTIVFGFVVVLYAALHKVKLAWTLFVILLIPILGSFYQAAVSVGLVGMTNLGLQSSKITFVVHAVLFSVCLARQIQIKIDSRIIAQHDGLTGLPRIELAKDFFSHSKDLADKNNWQVGVLFIDLDGFKKVNDNHGHKAGDDLLVEIANRIQSCLREVDTVARIGGDEFVVIQTEIKDSDAISVVAENILQVLKSPFSIDDKNIVISASIGVALYPYHGMLLKDLMRQADLAMYNAKSSGKNQSIIANINFNVAGEGS